MIIKDWRLPAFALLAHARASGVELPWEAYYDNDYYDYDYDYNL